MKVKVRLLFTGLILLMAFRWFIYMACEFEWFGFSLKDIISLVPFYISELAISSCYVVFLTKVYDTEPAKPARKASLPKTITSEQYI